RNHLSYKYKDNPIDIILSIGPSALEFALKLRATEWPAVPVVFVAVSEQSAPHPVPPNTTGIFLQKTFGNMVKAARYIVPNLKQLVFWGTPFGGGFYYPKFEKKTKDFPIRFKIFIFLAYPSGTYDSVSRLSRLRAQCFTSASMPIKNGGMFRQSKPCR